MIIAIASGKGGTGKTTVAVNLALAHAEQHPVFLDCDVEAPNAALFLHPTMGEREEVGVLVPEVDSAQCTTCGLCAEVCVYNAIAVIAESVLVFRPLCHGCGSCTLMCPEGAIREVLHVTGTVQMGRAEDIIFGHGLLNVGEAMAPPIIRQLKQRAIPPDSSDRLVILDAPPGSACPVVETMKGADVVLLVTEPTPFGLHDLRLAVEVARGELGLPVGVIINRATIGDDGVEEYCAQEHIPILLRIPFDRRIAEAYSDGIPLLRALPEYRPLFHSLLSDISDLTNLGVVV